VLFHKKGVLRRPRLRPHRHRGVQSAAIVLVLAQYREGVAEDSLEYQPVGSGREAISSTKFNIDVFHFEIGDRVKLLVLLLQWQNIPHLAVVGVVFEPDKAIIPEIAGEPRRRHKVGLAAWAEADIDDRIDDELLFFVADPDDRPDFKPPRDLRKLRQLLTELKVDTVEEAPLGGVGNYEQAADFGSVGKKFTNASGREGQVEADLPPFSEAISKFRRALQAMVRGEWGDFKTAAADCPSSNALG
jgi:hypothetical protein